MSSYRSEDSCVQVISFHSEKSGVQMTSYPSGESEEEFCHTQPISYKQDSTGHFSQGTNKVITMMTRRQREQPRYHLMLPVICVLCMGAVLCAEVRQYCIQGANRTSKINISCTRESDRIEVLQLYYAHVNLTVQPDGCQRPSLGTVTCRRTLTDGNDIKTQRPFVVCSGARQGCTPTLGDPPTMHSTSSAVLICPSFNFFYMEYSCIPEKEIVDLCGDGVMANLTSPTHLAYFRSPGDNPTQNCTCVINGGHHKLTAVHAGIPVRVPTCLSVSLRIVSNQTSPVESKSRSVTEGAPLINKDITTNSSDITQIYYTRDCSTLTPPVWFKIQFETDSRSTIRCGRSLADHNITTIPSDTTLSNTTAVNYTCEPDCSTTAITTTLPSSTTAADLTPPKTAAKGLLMNDKMPSTQGSPFEYTGLTRAKGQGHRSAETGCGALLKEMAYVTVITVSVIGGLLMVVMVTILVCVICRTSSNRKHPVPSSGIVTSDSETGRYEEAHMYHNDVFAADCTGEAQRHCITGNVITHLEKSNPNCSLSSQTTTNHCSRAASYDQDYDHIQSVPSTEPSRARNKQIGDDTYHKLYEGRECFKPQILYLGTDQDLYESSTDIAVNSPGARREGVYSEIRDPEIIHDAKRGKVLVAEDPTGNMLRAADDRTGGKLQIVDDLPRRRSPNPRTIVPDSYLYSTVNKPKMPLTFYHVLEKEDFRTSSEHDTQRSLTEKLGDGNGDQETTSQMSHGEDVESFRRDPTDAVQFVENDLYQSAGFVDNDLHHGAEFVENDLYQSAEFVDNDMAIVDKPKQSLPFHHVLQNEDFPTSTEHDDERRITVNMVDENGEQETASQISHGEDLEYPRRDPSEEVQFVDNDLYQDSEILGNDLYPTAEFVNDDLHQGSVFVDSDLYQGVENVDNDLHQSVQLVDNDLHQTSQFADKDLYEGSVFVENDLYQSAESL